MKYSSTLFGTTPIPYEHPVLTHVVLHLAAYDDLLYGNESPLQVGSRNAGMDDEQIRQTAGAISKARHTALSMSAAGQKILTDERLEFELGEGALLTLPTGVAELFAYRLSRLVGVRVPKIRLLSNTTMNLINGNSGRPTSDFYRQVPGGWCASSRVAQALPIYYLPVWGDTVAPIGKKYEEWQETLNLALKLRKVCPVDRTAYDDFPAEMEQDTRVLAAARWDSPQRILGHCFRALLNVSHGHTSNCLVDVRGRLWEIDFEKMMFREDHEDIADLLFLVEGSTRVRDACKQLCQISEDDIKDALSDIPDRYWRAEGLSVITRPELAYFYFAGRLDSWKVVFG